VWQALHSGSYNDVDEEARDGAFDCQVCGRKCVPCCHFDVSFCRVLSPPCVHVWWCPAIAYQVTSFLADDVSVATKAVTASADRPMSATQYRLDKLA